MIGAGGVGGPLDGVLEDQALIGVWVQVVRRIEARTEIDDFARAKRVGHDERQRLGIGPRFFL
ncbi:MAG: hypothetical protein ABI614_05915 [Planctomycetota bacterium]